MSSLSMRCSRFVFTLVFTGFSVSSVYSTFNFSSQVSSLKINPGGSLVFSTPVTGWDGTLAQRGIVTGSVGFNDGILNLNRTPAFFNGTFNTSSTQKLTLSGNQLLRVDPGVFAQRTLISGTGNRIEGQPAFSSDTIAAPNISLQNSTSSATLALTGKVMSYVDLNGGLITLDSDLNFADDRTFLGNGTVHLNNNRLIFGGSDFASTSTLLLVDATDVVLNAYTNLSGTWIFSGAQAHLSGNGNVLDLGTTGTIWIKAGTTLYMTDVTLRGLGQSRGSIVFESDTSRLRLSDTEIQLSNNYTVTNGGFYVDGPSTLIAKNYLLTFALQGTATVDGTTWWYNTTTYGDRNNIVPAATELSSSHIAYLNDGNICASSCINGLLRTTSNAMIYCCRTNSGALVYNNRVLSNAINNINNSIVANNLVRQISHALIYNERVLSNAMLYCCRTNSGAFNYSNRVTSNAINNIVNGPNSLRTVSNALVYNDRVLSNAMLYCCRTNSGAFNYSNRVTSNAINNIIEGPNSLRTVSNALVYNDRVLSNAMLYCCRTNSGAFNYSNRVNSNALNFISVFPPNALIRQISNATLYCCRNASNAFVYNDRVISNALVYNDRVLSNVINTVLPCAVSRFIQPCETLTYAVDTTIDLDGGVWVFADPNHAQFVVNDGVTVTLRNMTMSRINNNTFVLGEGSRLAIDANVFFELEEDVQFDTGQIVAVGTLEAPIVFEVRGLNGIRKFTLNSPVTGPVVDLGLNAMALQNIELEGLDRVSVSEVVLPDDTLFVGILGMRGESVINVNVDTSMNFFIEGQNNFCAMQDNNLNFNRFFIFGDKADNDIHFTIRPPIGGLTLPTFGLGNNAIFLTSTEGRAGVYFDDSIIRVSMLGSDSFLLGDNSYIVGNAVIVQNSPIKQTSTKFTLGAGTILTAEAPVANAIDPSFIRGIIPGLGRRNASTISSAIQYLNKKKQGKPVGKLQAKEDAAAQIAQLTVQIAKPVAQQVAKPEKSAQKPYNKPKPQKPAVRELDLLTAEELNDLLILEALEDRELSADELTLIGFRAANSVPTDGIAQNVNSAFLQLTEPSGDLLVQNNAGILQVGTSPNVYRIFMNGNATLQQSDTDSVIGGEFLAGSPVPQEINVAGLNNKIQVKKTLEFGTVSLLNFAANSAITFELFNNATLDLTKVGSKLTSASSTTPGIVLDENVVLEFSGKGTVYLPANINLGTNSTIRATNGVVVKFITPELNRECANEFATTVVSTINGVGTLYVADGARFVVSRDQEVIVCTADTDDISVIIIDSGMVNISGLPSVDCTPVPAQAIPMTLRTGRMTFGFGTFRFDVTQDGILKVGPGGILTLNDITDTGTPVRRPGLFERICVSYEGVLDVHQRGQLIVRPNHPDFAQEIIVNFLDGILKLPGSICFDDPENPLRIAPLACCKDEIPCAIGSKSAIEELVIREPFVVDSADQFVGLLINQQSALKNAVAFIGCDGKKYISMKYLELASNRTLANLCQEIFDRVQRDARANSFEGLDIKNQWFVCLDNNDDLTSLREKNNCPGWVFGSNASLGNNFRITPDGLRIVPCGRFLDDEEENTSLLKNEE